jgi:hypothetical protein
MRLQALVLPALLLALACKSDPGDETGGSSTGAAACTVDAVVGDLDPNYPPCDCDFKCEDEQALCNFTDMSSICEPQCTNGPTCKNDVDACDDSDCPALAGLTATCDRGRCKVYCDEAQPCPTGYVCIENIKCQAQR